ncbi:apolipoprotein N-acyltransferase [Roseomonas fluvialis]|uniref:Apolipoprotein N-acyltransferase n=1 Tax=Roseomonas fluvialis TaxID=1750527 RepID=A0ABN6NZ20_9PROT|nr:apolipoprotein N-acyltransferase [Roseomonas fluvialis]
MGRPAPNDSADLHRAMKGFVLPRTRHDGACVTRSQAARGPIRRVTHRMAYGATALGLGALSAIALAPLHIAPAGVVAFGGLWFQLERTASLRGAFVLGWLFGLGSFLVGLSWITEAFSADAARFGALALPALAALSAGLALFPACSVAAARLLAGRAGGVPLALALAAFWGAGEWLRGAVLTGFPWNIAGHAWGASDAGLQAAALVGIHGLGLLAVLAAVLAGVAVRQRRVGPALAATVIIALPWAWGTTRLADAMPADAPGIRLRLVQPNIAQDLKWAEGERERILGRLLALSAAPAADGVAPTHIIWPESAVPYLLAESPAIRAEVARIIPPGGALLTGAVRRTIADDGGPALLNSLVALDDTGAITAAYDKIQLVPFGEYQPLRRLLADLPKITVGTVDFIPGPPREAMRVAGLPPLWPLICYEAIFPTTLPAQGPAPGWILTVTNDAWFGTSWGPYQHALAARLRAIELGLPLIRVANSGISLVTDAVGRERARLPLATEGVLDLPLPAALPGGTPYARFGDLPVAIGVAALAGIALAGRRRA